MTPAERIAELEKENASLRNQLGDNLCWLDHSSTSLDAAKILPEAEFLESCRRYHMQIVTGLGVFTGGMTIAQLEQRVAELEALLYGWQALQGPGTVCGCGLWLASQYEGRHPHPANATPCLHCRTRVALAGDCK